MSIKRKLVVGTSILAAAAFAGGAYAASKDSGANTRQAYLNDVAKRLNVSPQQLSSALKGAFLDQLNAAVASGKLSQAQANAIKQHLQQGVLPPLGLGFRGGPPGFGLHREGPFQHGGEQLSATAKYLGLTESQLRSQLQSGQSLAQIAKSRGKSVSGLEDALKASVKAQLDKAVAAKMLTSQEEQEILSRLSQELSFKINHSGFGSGRYLHPRGTFRYPSAPVPPPGLGSEGAPPPGPVY